ncbi:MAG TPA: prolyl oligopeptidase family serine peptidase, partial [Rhizomicrobium sp.]|nr:prolyl oligopeptidase family serine peptidase [Rhizomicrobium sp.]
AALAAETLTPDSPDPYLWLTDIHGAKPQAWIKDQNAKSFAVLRSDPAYQADHDNILEILNANDRIPEPDLHKDMVWNFWQDKDHVRGLWRQTSIADYASAKPHWDVLLDVDKLDATEHKQWVFQGANCAPSEKRCLLRLSPGGGDASAVREFDPKTKTFIADGFTLDVAKSDATYLDDDTVLVATDFGPGSLTKSSYPRIVKLWHRGTPLSAAKTVYETSADDVAARPRVFRGPYGTIPLIERQVSFFEDEIYYVLADGSTMKLPLPLDADMKGVTNGNIIFTLRKAWTAPGGQHFAQGSLIAFPVKPFAVQKMQPTFALLYAPDARATIDEVSPGQDAVYASIYENVIGGVHEFRAGKDGKWSDTKLNLPPGGSARVISTNDWGPQAYFEYESFLKPPTLYAYDGNAAPNEIKSEPARFDANTMAVEQYEAKSADGTEIPYFYIHPKNAKGPIPTILYSYGGFEMSLTPWYWNDGHRPIAPGQAWFDKGGAIVVANIRGGGEFGPAWHQAALLQNRQRAFDDFEGVAIDIAKRGFATPKQIGIVGASNGGLLVSTVMVQRPELFGAVVCQRPLIDMLRYTHFGAGASWVGEYGDPANPKDRAWILKYSPYELVKKDGHYPPAFFITETSDDRVTPVFARMMAAKMEEQGHNVLFYESAEGGHGPGVTNEAQAEMWALSYVYFAQKLGLENNLAPGAMHTPKH